MKGRVLKTFAASDVLIFPFDDQFLKVSRHELQVNTQKHMVFITMFYHQVFVIEFQAVRRYYHYRYHFVKKLKPVFQRLSKIPIQNWYVI